MHNSSICKELKQKPDPFTDKLSFIEVVNIINAMSCQFILMLADNCLADLCEILGI